MNRQFGSDGAAARWSRKFVLGLMASMTVVLSACQSTADSTGPSGPDLRLSRVGTQSLKQLEESEKRRIDAAQEASKPLYDALKIRWQEFLDSKPVQGAGTLLTCDPIQYVATVKIIGKEGGDLDFGPHKLHIPRGALDQPTVITAEGLTSLNVETKFSPHGTRFLKAPTLSLSYQHCYLPRDFAGHSVVYLNEHGQIIEEPVSRDYQEYDYVAAEIWHFSRYAIAY